MKVEQTSFASGQLSKLFLGRVETAEYRAGALSLVNMIVGQYGHAGKRPGSEHLAGADGPSKLLPFFPRSAEQYVVEVSNLVTRIWSVATRSIVASLTTPWTSTQANDIQFAQSPEVLYVAQEDHHTKKFFVNADGELEVDNIAELPSLSSEASDRTQLLRTEVDVTFDQDYSVFAGDEGDERQFFESGDLRTLWRVSKGWFDVLEVVSAEEVSVDYWDANPPFGITTDDWVGPFRRDRVISGIRMRTFDPGYGPGNLIELEATDGSGNLVNDVFNELDVGGMIDASWGGVPGQYVFHIFDVRDGGSKLGCQVARVIGGSGGPVTHNNDPAVYHSDLRDVPNKIVTNNLVEAGETTKIYCNVELFGSEVNVGDTMTFNGGAATITSVLSPHQAEAEITDGFVSRFSTPFFSIEANLLSGFPRAVAFHQNRLVVGGIKAAPNSVFGSQAGQHERFRITSTNSDAPFDFRMTSSRGDRIAWIQSASDVVNQGAAALAIGTDEAEYVLSGFPLSTTSTGVDQISNYGSRSVQPVQAKTSLFFAERNGRAIRDMRFFRDLDELEDVTLNASDIFEESPVRSMAFMRHPDESLVVVREDESVASMSFRRQFGVLAWSPWTIKASSVVRASGANRDELWMCVRHGDTYAIEVLRSGSSAEYHDSWIKPQVNGLVLSGLDHLEGKLCSVRIGDECSERTVEPGGTIILDSPVPAGVDVSVGLAFAAQLAPLYPEIQRGDGSPSTGDPKHITCVSAHLTKRSKGGTFGGYELTRDRSGNSRWWRAEGIRSHDVSPEDPIESVKPFPFEVLAVTAEYGSS